MRIVQQSNRVLAPAVSTISKTVHPATRSSPNAHNSFVALIHWAAHSLQLVYYFFTNYVLYEWGFAQLVECTHQKITSIEAAA